MKQPLGKRTLLLVLAAILFLTAWNRGIPLLYLMFALIVATLLLGQMFPMRTLSSIEVRRIAPRRAAVGDVAHLQFELTNRGVLPRFMLEIIDHFPAGEYGQTEPMLFVSHLPSRSNRVYEMRVPCAVRGEYTLGPLQLASAFPLGIARRKKSARDEETSLLVYPATFPIAYIPISPSSAMHREGGESVSTAGGSEEFFGIREYREGDSIRMVHWPSSARRNQLLVKEMEVRISAQVSLLLDLSEAAHAGVGSEHSLEYAVTIAASVCLYILERQHQMQVIGHGPRPYISPCRHGMEHLQEIMTLLAKAQTGNVPFHQVVGKADALMQDGQSVILVCSGRSLDTVQMQQTLAMLHAKRMQVIVVLIETGGFGGKDHPGLLQLLAKSGVQHHRIGKGEAFSSLFPMQ